MMTTKENKMCFWSLIIRIGIQKLNAVHHAASFLYKPNVEQ